MDIYKRLATFLDNLPGGFPATADGVELRILKRLFTPEEAEIAMGLTLMVEPADVIADRLKMDPVALAPVLESMSKKGLIFRTTKGGRQVYMAAQFVIGIWEYHLNDLDEALIRDVNAYLPHLVNRVWLKQKTKQLRVIPIKQSVSERMEVMPYEIAEEIIQKQKRIVVSPCICRKEHRISGQHCDYPLETCFTFGRGARYYEENGLGRAIAAAEALDILKEGVEAGLVLQPGNSQRPVNICMCCGCCCQVLKNLSTLEKPALAFNSSYLAAVDDQVCIGCGDCEARCHMHAISIGDTARVDVDRCIGCGVCVPVCEVDAIQLFPKEEENRWVPPANTLETYVNIARERGLGGKADD